MGTYAVTVCDRIRKCYLYAAQNVTASQSKRNINVHPNAFTEQGVAMLSGILNSDKAISMNIAIMRAFVEMRRIILKENKIISRMRGFDKYRNAFFINYFYNFQ